MRFGLKKRASDKWPTNGGHRRTPKVAWHEPTTKRNQPSRQTILYVPLPGFGWLAAVVAARECCNLLQTVSNDRRDSKLLQTVHKLLQSVAKRSNLQIKPRPCVGASRKQIAKMTMVISPPLVGSREGLEHRVPKCSRRSLFS
jgi:hypothetical protein